MPYAKPKPKPMLTEGRHYAVILPGTVLEQKRIKKNTVDERDVDILRVPTVNLIPDEKGQIEVKTMCDVFIETDPDRASGNWGYLRFLEAVNLGIIEQDGKEMLPDPDPEYLTGKFISYVIFHDTWTGERGTYTNAKAKEYQTWDGMDPETGEKIVVNPELLQVQQPLAGDDKVPF